MTDDLQDLFSAQNTTRANHRADNDRKSGRKHSSGTLEAVAHRERLDGVLGGGGSRFNPGRLDGRTYTSQRLSNEVDLGAPLENRG